jgi:hypothetical protein
LCERNAPKEKSDANNCAKTRVRCHKVKKKLNNDRWRARINRTARVRITGERRESAPW